MSTGQVVVAVFGVVVFGLGLWLLLRRREATDSETATGKTPVVTVSGPPGLLILLAGTALAVWPFTPLWLVTDTPDEPTVSTTPTPGPPPEPTPTATATETESPETPDEEDDAEAVRVPSVWGYPEAAGVSRLSELGLKVAVLRECSAEVGEGLVHASLVGDASGGSSPRQDATGMLLLPLQTVTLLVSTGPCSAVDDCLALRPSDTKKVRFGRGSESGESRIQLQPREAIAFSLGVSAQQVIQVSVTPLQEGSQQLICVLDPDGRTLIRDTSIQVTTGPLAVSGNHTVIVAETAGSPATYRVRFVIPAS